MGPAPGTAHSNWKCSMTVLPSPRINAGAGAGERKGEMKYPGIPPLGIHLTEAGLLRTEHSPPPGTWRKCGLSSGALGLHRQQQAPTTTTPPPARCQGDHWLKQWREGEGRAHHPPREACRVAQHTQLRNKSPPVAPGARRTVPDDALDSGNVVGRVCHSSPDHKLPNSSPGMEEKAPKNPAENENETFSQCLKTIHEEKTCSFSCLEQKHLQPEE